MSGKQLSPAQQRRVDALKTRLRKRDSFGPGLCHRLQATFVRACLDFSREALRSITCLAGRQSGKSWGAVMAALLLAIANPGCNVLYVTATYASCKKMAYKPAKGMVEEFFLGGKANDSEQSITFKNGATVYFLGADRDNTIQRLRGTPNLVACYVDEAGIYESDQLHTILETVRPGLRPRAGKLILLGTPSLAGKQGTWYDATQNAAYDHHFFTYRDNDKVPSFDRVEELIDEDLRAQGVTRDSAYFKREYLALFEVELAEHVYFVDDSIFYDDEPPNDRHTCAAGGDLGSTANDALVVAGWGDAAVAYVDEEQAIPGQDSLQFAAMVGDVFRRRHPITIQVDPGGLGEKTIATVKSLMPAVPIVAVAKPPVAIQVRVLNALLKAGRLKVRRGSQLAQELVRPTWVNGIVGGEINEHGRHSDLVPALRYLAIAITPLLPDLPVPNQLPTDPVELQRVLDAAYTAEADARAEERRRREQAPSWAQQDLLPATDPFSTKELIWPE